MKNGGQCKVSVKIQYYSVCACVGACAGMCVCRHSSVIVLSKGTAHSWKKGLAAFSWVFLVVIPLCSSITFRATKAFQVCSDFEIFCEDVTKTGWVLRWAAVYMFMGWSMIIWLNDVFHVHFAILKDLCTFIFDCSLLFKGFHSA